MQLTGAAVNWCRESEEKVQLTGAGKVKRRGS